MVRLRCRRGCGGGDEVLDGLHRLRGGWRSFQWSRRGRGLRLIRKPDPIRALDSASDFARVNPDGGADETAEGKIGGLAKVQACAGEGPGSAGQDAEGEKEDREEAESGGRDEDSPVPKAAGEGYRTRTQARGAGTTRRQAPRGSSPEHGNGPRAWGAWSDAG